MQDRPEIPLTWAALATEAYIDSLYKAERSLLIGAVLLWQPGCPNPLPWVKTYVKLRIPVYFAGTREYLKVHGNGLRRILGGHKDCLPQQAPSGVAAAQYGFHTLPVEALMHIRNFLLRQDGYGLI